MNAMTHMGQPTRPGVGSTARRHTTTALDLRHLAAGAARRREMLHDLEARMDQACENAVKRAMPRQTAEDRAGWNNDAWDRYLHEAIIQARLHGDELARLHRDAAYLDRLIACVS